MASCWRKNRVRPCLIRENGYLAKGLEGHAEEFRALSYMSQQFINLGEFPKVLCV
jgi:hypothetical protein